MKHHELATFTKEDGKWYFVDGKAATPQQYVRSDTQDRTQRALFVRERQKIQEMLREE